MSKDLKVSLDSLIIKNDHDPWPKGSGEIYFYYSLDSGGVDHDGRSDQWSLDGGDSVTLGREYDFNFLSVKDALTISIAVWEADSDSDHDHLRKDLNVTFSADENFGIGDQEWDTKDYTLEYTIFEV